MKRVLKNLPILVCLFLWQTNLQASSHREAPLIAYDPQADNTDVYAFRSPCDSSKVVLIANYIPFQHPAGGPNWYHFGTGIRYEIHIKNKTTTLTDDITYRFTFSQVNQDPTTFFNIRLGKENQKTTYILEKITYSNFGVPTATTIVANGKVPANNIGPRSIESGVGLGATAGYDSVRMSTFANATGGGGERVFAGPSDDPFFVDLGGAFDLGNFRLTGRDGLAKMNVHSICIEVPIATVQKDGLPVTAATGILNSNYVIGVWASASRQAVTTQTGVNTGTDSLTTSGAWVQVSRLGMPLTNEVINPIADKDKWNATNPYSGGENAFTKNFVNPELGLYMDNSRFGPAVPGLSKLRIQTKSLATASDPKGFDFRNDSIGLYKLKGNAALNGTALAPNSMGGLGDVLLPDNHSPRSVDLLPIFNTGVPNLPPYQLATGKPQGSPLSAGKPFINNFLLIYGDMLRLNMAVPVTPRKLSNGTPNPDFSTLGLVQAAVLGLTDSRFNANASLQNIPNMDGFPNGRRLEDDVTTIELQAVSGVVLAAIGLWYDDYNVSTPGANPVTNQLGNVLGFNAGVTKNDTTLPDCFPYVQGPWRGFTGAQYAGPTSCGPATDRLYVDSSVAASGTGSSWQCGLKNVSEAIAIANNNPAIKSIWVAKGTYTNGTDRNASMVISRADLRILGGFNGTETVASQANPAVNTTIISGAIGTPANTDNTRNLLIIYGVPNNASQLVIDGFTFSNGYGENGSAIQAAYNTSSTPIYITRSIFRNNFASNAGGAVNMDNSPIRFDSCRFLNNSAAIGGATFSFQSTIQIFYGCVFAGNTASNSGGACYGNYGLTRIASCAFNGNSAVYGGAIYQNRVDMEYYNVVFSNNTAAEAGGAMYQHSRSNSLILNGTYYNNAARSGGAIILGFDNCYVHLWNSIMYRNTANGVDNTAGSDILNISSTAYDVKNSSLQANTVVSPDNGTTIKGNIRGGVNPQFTNQASPVGADGIWFTTDDGLQIAKLSPLLNMGDNSLAPGATDINNLPRIACGTVDLGSYEVQNCAGPNRQAPVKTDIAGIVANPFTSDLQIRYAGEEKANIQVSSLSGKVMAVSATASKGTTHVNTANWNSGVYLVEIVTISGKKLSFKALKL